MSSKTLSQQEVTDLGNNFIRSQLVTNRLPYSARLYWQSLDSSLAQLRDAVGIAPAASSATMLRPTAFHESLVPLLDLAALTSAHVVGGHGNPDGMHWGWDAHQVVGAALAETIRTLLKSEAHP